MRVGCDVVDVARFSATLDRRPAMLERVFTERERSDAARGGLELTHPMARARLAARWAAKEALRKATGDLRLGFTESEVRSAPDGAPGLFLHGTECGSVSLSHDGGVAMAVVLLESVPPSSPAVAAATLPQGITHDH